MPPAVYLHLPFCANRCRYCGFYSGEPLSRFPELVERLGTEMELRSNTLSGPVASVYFGGGTPSLLGPEPVRHLLERIRRTWGLRPDAEVSLEANPGDSLPLREFREAGVTRLSVGVQALDDDVLRELGRRHNAAQARRSVAAARAAGIPGISGDLILGLGATSPEQLAKWVNELVDLGVGHLSLYSLELHPGTELAEAAAAGCFRPADEGTEEAQYHAVAEAAANRGLEAYEVSNFAAEGQLCRHNLIYWRGGAYLGLGPGAHSFFPDAGPWGRRRWNTPDLGEYLDALRAGGLPPGDGEELSRQEALLECLFLGLRCRDPLAPAELADRFGLAPEAAAARFREMESKGLLEALPGGRVRPGPDALRRADGLALTLHQQLLDGPGPS